MGFDLAGLGSQALASLGRLGGRDGLPSAGPFASVCDCLPLACAAVGWALPSLARQRKLHEAGPVLIERNGRLARCPRLLLHCDLFSGVDDRVPCNKDSEEGMLTKRGGEIYEIMMNKWTLPLGNMVLPSTGATALPSSWLPRFSFRRRITLLPIQPYLAIANHRNIAPTMQKLHNLLPRSGHSCPA